MSPKSIKKEMKKRRDELYNSLIGTIVITIGMLCDKDEAECRKEFLKLKLLKNKLPNTVQDICEYIWKEFGDDERKQYRRNMVLIVDLLNVRSPIVCLTDDEGHVLPLKRNGEMNVMQMIATKGDEHLSVEYIYDENGELLEDE